MIWGPARNRKQGQLVATIYQRGRFDDVVLAQDLGHLTDTDYAS
jgi:hypothetical protein